MIILSQKNGEGREMRKMDEKYKKLLVEDVLAILSSSQYKGKIVKSDLVNELRGSFLRSSSILSNRWHLSIYFINSELEDILKEAGFSITYKTSKRGYNIATFYSL
jgi:hypothetical protein